MKLKYKIIGGLVLTALVAGFLVYKFSPNIFGATTGLTREWVFDNSSKLTRSLTTSQGTLITRTGETATTTTSTLQVIGSADFGNATTTNLAVTGLTSGRCVEAGTGGHLLSASAACGTGSGGGAAWEWDGTHLTPTSTVAIAIKSTSATSTIAHSLIVDTSTLVVNASEGRVGIGTASPGYTLEVNGTINIASGNLLRIAGEGALDRTDSNNKLIVGSTAANKYVTIASGAVDDALTVAATGNVGIGTTGPTTNNATGAKVLDITAAAAGQSGLAIHTTGVTQELSIITDAGVGAYFDIAGSATAANNFFQFRTVNTNSDHTTRINAMRITSAGNVGIGTTGPGSTLDIDRANASSITAEQITFRSQANTQTLTDGTAITDWRANQFLTPTVNGVAAGGTESITNLANVYIEGAPSGSNISNTNEYALWVDGGTARFDGNVGIGTTLPGDLVHVDSSTSDKTLLRLQNTNADNLPARLTFIKDSASPAASDDLGKIDFYGDDSAANSDRFAFMVGYASDVTSTSEDGGIYFSTLTAGSAVRTMDIVSGNVGIGTTTPQFILSVENSSEGDTFQLYDTDGNCLQDPDSGGITTSCSSDEKYKENIRDTSLLAVEKLRGINIRDYDLRSTGESKTGVVAQELELTRPDLVRDITFTYTEQIFDGEATTTATTTETTKFVTLPSIWEMVKAIQELDAKQQDLEARVEVLEGKSLTAIGSTSPLAGLWAGIASLFARLIINLS